jgi:hypothetical protein
MRRPTVQAKSKVPPLGTVFMIVDPLTREAYRECDDPASSGPLFFTSREALEAYAREEAIEEYAIHEVPEGVLSRMKGKPHWVDGKRAG